MSQPAAQPHPFQLAGHIQRGDMAPWWNQGVHRFLFDPLVGRYIVLAFQGVRGDPPGEARAQALPRLARFAAAEGAFFLGVSCDPKAQAGDETADGAALLRPVFDADAAMHRAYGIGAGRAWIVLDPMLRVIEMIPFRDDAADIGQLADLLDGLPPPAQFLGVEMAPPVLMLRGCVRAGALPPPDRPATRAAAGAKAASCRRWAARRSSTTTRTGSAARTAS